MNRDELPHPPEDFMTAEELMALPGYVRPMDEVLEEAKKRAAFCYPCGGFAIVEPDKPDGDVIIVISRRR